MAEEIEGGCLCGQVRYTATGPPINARVCHCRRCQKGIGAAFHARLLYRQAEVSIRGEVTTYSSSPGAKRGFCPVCGATVFSASDIAGVIGLSSGSLDDPSMFAPTAHIWTASRQPWVCLDDGVAQYPGAAPP